MSDTTPSKLELLKMARELVINEYIDKRAQDHNKWLADSEVAWKTKGIKLPYPSFPIYPTEAEIVARANVLDEFLNKGKKEEPAPAPVPAVEPEPEPEPKPALEQIPSISTGTMPVPPPVSGPLFADDSYFKNQLDALAKESTQEPASLLAKLEQLKSNWGKK